MQTAEGQQHTIAEEEVRRFGFQDILVMIALCVFFPLLWTDVLDRSYLLRRQTQPGIATLGINLLQGIRLLWIAVAWLFAWTWLAVFVMTVTLGWRWHKTWAAWCGSNWWFFRRLDALAGDTDMSTQGLAQRVAE